MIGVNVGVYLVSFHGWHDCVSERTWCCFMVGTNMCVCTWCHFYVGVNVCVSVLGVIFMVGINV